MSLGSRGGELMRVVARDRYVNGLNGEFLCVKGRFGHPFVNHEARLRTPLIRYKKGGKLIPATWDEAIRFTAERLDQVADQFGRNSVAVVGSPRLSNESLYALYKFATELVGTDTYTTTDAFSLRPFFDNLGGQLATHKDIRYAKTILLIGGEPEELQPLTGKQIRQAVRNGGAKLIIANSIPIRLCEQAAQFVHADRFCQLFFTRGFRWCCRECASDYRLPAGGSIHLAYDLRWWCHIYRRASLHRCCR